MNESQMSAMTNTKENIADALWGESHVTGGFSSERASSAKNVPMW